MARGGDKKGGGVVIKKNEIIEGGHHGGAWKVAYADFVTAMMAFFLLMWLLNATTEDQRKGLADYFSPNNLLSHASSGTGQPFGGHTAFDDGALVSDRGSVEIVSGKRPPVPPPDDAEADAADSHGPASNDAVDTHGKSTTGQAALRVGPNPDAQSLAGTAVVLDSQMHDGGRKPTPAEVRAEQEKQEKAAFEAAAQQIREAVKADPALADLGRQLSIDMTPDGLRIQIMDEIKLPMFASGSAEPNERARLLLQKVVPVLAKLPEAISVAGHTDAAPFPGPGRTNWELSTERANATRRLLVEGGLPEGRIRSVTGNADKDPLLPADPMAAANRRIAIVVLRTRRAES
ncbi:MAG: flagellar motor protein MotB [Rhodospirillales bacterium]